MSNASVERNGFCLGCGKDVGTVFVPYHDYYAPPDTAVPSWCREAACRTARDTFRALTDRILSEARAEKEAERAKRFGWH